MNVKQKTHTRKIEHLFAEIAKSITSSLDRNKIIAKVMKEIDLFYKPDNWSLALIDENENNLYSLKFDLNLYG